ncbi:MAG: putative sulfate exporter family transporter [Colwellia sp.]|nr:putative sulfate exporter family transporter [Colwellia sp.]
MLNHLKSKYSGVMICSLIAVVAATLANRYNAPVMLFALLLGLAMHFLYESDKHQEGIEFCSKSLLRIAVGLLGVRIALSDIVSLGFTAPLIVISSMGLTIGFGILLARVLGLSKSFGVLTGGAVAVCGVSAAAAISTVLPKKDFEEQYFALTVIGITTLSTLAMITYPIITTLFDLPDNLAGVFIGGSIHDVAQVVGAGYSISPEAGDIATYIKLLRVALLLPIVMIIFVSFKNRSATEESLPLTAKLTSFIPGFLIGFFILAVLNNLGLIPELLVQLFQVLSNWLLVIAIVAIGLKTSLKQIASVGWRPVFLLTAETVFFAGLILAGILILL